jgi:DNA-binding CsgD family transcriptional regulator
VNPPDELLDLIYDAATDDALWTQALIRIADLTGSLGGMIIGIDNRTHAVPVIHNARMSDDSHRVYRERHFVNPWWHYMHTCPSGKAVQSEDIVPLEDLKRTDFFNEVLRPQGMAHNFMVPLSTKPDLQIGFNICRSESQGRLSEDGVRLFNALYPHLRRSLLLGFRLDGYRELQSAAFRVLDRLSTGIVLLDARARPVFMNAAATGMSRPGGAFRTSPGGIAISSLPHALKLERLVQRALAGAPLGVMTIPHPADGRLLSVLVSPLRSRDLDRFRDAGMRDAAILLQVTDPLAVSEVPPDWLREAYGLTRAEAKVALGVSVGCAIPQLAIQLGLSANTVKTHLRRVFIKAGISRQSELALLVASLGVIRPDDRD